MIDLIATRNIANYGRGSEMTRALHDTCNEIERLTAELVEYKEGLGHLLKHGYINRYVLYNVLPEPDCPAIIKLLIGEGHE